MQNVKFFGLAAFSLSVVVVFSTLGCTKIGVNATAKVTAKAAPAFESYWDYEIAGEAAPGNIIQMEGMLRISPENKTILLSLIRMYTAYAFGWVEDNAEVADIKGDTEEGDYQRRRAQLMYLRARDLGKYLISLDVEGFDEAMTQGLPAFEAWLKNNFDDKEDGAALLWTGYAWGNYINQSKDDMGAVADLAYAKALIERSVLLDPTYFNGTGTAFLAVAETSGMSADMDKAEALWKQAFERSEERALMLFVTKARTFAVKKGDKAMYIELLKKVMDAGDIMPESRLANRIAKRRAKRYLSQLDKFFPELTPAPAAEAPTEAADETKTAETTTEAN